MKVEIDPKKLEEAKRILSTPLPIVPEEISALSKSRGTLSVHVSDLDVSLNLLLEAKPFSIRLQPPPPLWSKADNELVRQYYEKHPDHPLADDDHARNRRRAAYKLMFWASIAPGAFTSERTNSLCDCLFDCDASVRHDVLRAIAFLKPASASLVLSELLERESESDTIRAMAAVTLDQLKETETRKHM